jgi:hypothetical protein
MHEPQLNQWLFQILGCSKTHHPLLLNFYKPITQKRIQNHCDRKNTDLRKGRTRHTNNSMVAKFQNFQDKTNLSLDARMAELVDALDSKSSSREGVRVRPPLRVPLLNITFL